MNYGNYVILELNQKICSQIFHIKQSVDKLFASC